MKADKLLLQDFQLLFLAILLLLLTFSDAQYTHFKTLWSLESANAATLEKPKPHHDGITHRSCTKDGKSSFDWKGLKSYNC